MHGCVLRARSICVNICKALKRRKLFPALRITPRQPIREEEHDQQGAPDMGCFDSAVTAALRGFRSFFFFLFMTKSRHVPTARSSAAQVTGFCRGERKQREGWGVVAGVS